MGRHEPEYVLVVSCYFDDSRGDGVHAIAGYVGRADLWDGEFVDRWCEALSSGPRPISEYKTSHNRHLAGEFNGWTRDQANEVALNCLHVVGGLEPRVFGVGAAIYLPADEHSSPPLVLEQVALRIAFMEILAVVLNLAQSIGAEHTVQCVCDEQPGLQGLLQDTFAKAREFAMRDAPCRISHLQFEDSKEVLPLQAADILAYETRKDVLNRMEQPQRPRSRALRYLVRSQPHLGWALTPGFIDFMVETPTPGAQSPPLLYYSPEVFSALPQVFHGSRLELDPPPVIPDDEGGPA